MAKIYTTKTASLKATQADVRKLSTKEVNAQDIKINGQKIQELWGFKVPEDLQKICSRVDFNTIDTPYVLYTDTGNPVYISEITDSINNKFAYHSDITEINFDTSTVTKAASAFEECKGLTKFENNLELLDNGNSMFYNCSNLKSFKSPSLNSLSNGRYMFYNCSNLETFDADITSSKKIDGYNMFKNTMLNKESAVNVLTAIKNKKFSVKWSNVSDPLDNSNGFYDDGIISIGLNSLLKGDADVNAAIGNFASYELVINSNGPTTMGTKQLVTDVTLSTLNAPEFYIPDTNGYHTLVMITWSCNDSVIDTSFNSQTSTIIKGYKCFSKLKNLTSFSADLTALTDGSMMFAESENLESFTSSTPSLVDGGEMFRQCTSLYTFSGNTSLLTNGRYMFYGCHNLGTFNGSLAKLEDGTSMFTGCRLTLESVQHIVSQLQQNTAGADATKVLHLGVHASYKDSEEFHNALGISVGTYGINVTNAVGQTWSIGLEFN